GDVAEFAGCLDPLRDLSASLGGEQLDLPLELLVALWSEDYVLHDHRPPGLEREKAAALGRQRGREGYLRVQTNVKAQATISRNVGGLAHLLAHPRRRDPDAARARAHGARQRAGLPAPGSTLRRGAR